jgi:hypothetical protein
MPTWRVVFNAGVTVTLKCIVVAVVSARYLDAHHEAPLRNASTAVGLSRHPALIAIAITYLTNFSIPMKFFLPGMFFLFAFVVRTHPLYGCNVRGSITKLVITSQT